MSVKQGSTVYHYSQTAKKFGSWTHEVMLLVKVAKSGGKRSGILGSETSFRCFGVSLSSKSTCEPALMRTEREIGKIYNIGLQSGSQKSVWAGDKKLICNKWWP